MIPFNKAIYLEDSMKYVADAIQSSNISGDGKYTKLCNEWMEQNFNAKKVLMTTSCTAALEMSAILLDIKPGDEVIMPSYTFVSTANAFVLHGAKIIFVDIRPDTMNLNEQIIERAITDKTKAIVVVHYAGVSCEMEKIVEISEKYNIPVVEDAAQGVMSCYKDRALGTIGDLGCYSFHETKNYTMGEGGALIINNEKYLERAEIIREKGTNRSKFFRGEIDKYSWVDIGSSFLPSEINVAYLYGQLLKADEIKMNRLQIWNEYDKSFRKVASENGVELPVVPNECKHNAHMYYLKLKDIHQRSDFIKFAKSNGFNCVFHYVPLHSAEGGKKFGSFLGNDKYTTRESERLVRLPLYYGMTEEDKKWIIEHVVKYIMEL